VRNEAVPLRLEPRSDVQLSPTKPIQVTVAAWVRPKPSERVELVCRGRKLRADEPVTGLDEEVTVVLESNREALDPAVLPRLTRPGYSTDPSLAVMSHMSLAELQRVRDFTVCNEHGEVVFEGETNVAGVDLDAIVQIESRQWCCTRKARASRR